MTRHPVSMPRSSPICACASAPAAIDGRPSISELQLAEGSMTPASWQWYGNTKMHEVYLSTIQGGRKFVMDFERWGMRGAQPRFQIDQRMITLGELGKQEHPLGPRFEVPYRRQFAGIGHPDPSGIVALRNAAPALLEIVAAVFALGPELGYLVGPRSELLRDTLAKVRP